MYNLLLIALVLLIIIMLTKPAKVEKLKQQSKALLDPQIRETYPDNYHLQSTDQMETQNSVNEGIMPYADSLTRNYSSFDINEQPQSLQSKLSTAEISKILNEQNKKEYDFNAQEYLPKEYRDDWFQTDVQMDNFKINSDALINPNPYIVGIPTAAGSHKNANYDLRPSPPCPKITTGPWQQSTIMPDYNIKSL